MIYFYPGPRKEIRMVVIGCAVFATIYALVAFLVGSIHSPFYAFVCSGSTWLFIFFITYYLFSVVDENES